MIQIQNKDNQVNKKLVYILLLSGAFFCLLFLGLLNYYEGKVSTISLDTVQKGEGFSWRIDKIEEISHILIIQGVFYKNDESIRTFNNHVLLEDISTGKVYILPTESQVKSTVVEIDQYDYSQFLSEVCVQKLDIDHHEYKIMFLYESNNQRCYVDTGITISQWRMNHDK